MLHNVNPIIKDLRHSDQHHITMMLLGYIGRNYQIPIDEFGYIFYYPPLTSRLVQAFENFIMVTQFIVGPNLRHKKTQGRRQNIASHFLCVWFQDTSFWERDLSKKRSGLTINFVPMKMRHIMAHTLVQYLYIFQGDVFGLVFMSHGILSSSAGSRLARQKLV